MVPAPPVRQQLQIAGSSQESRCLVLASHLREVAIHGSSDTGRIWKAQAPGRTGHTERPSSSHPCTTFTGLHTHREIHSHTQGYGMFTLIHILHMCTYTIKHRNLQPIHRHTPHFRTQSTQTHTCLRISANRISAQTKEVALPVRFHTNLFSVHSIAAQWGQLLISVCA